MNQYPRIQRHHLLWKSSKMKPFMKVSSSSARVFSEASSAVTSSITEPARLFVLPTASMPSSGSMYEVTGPVPRRGALVNDRAPEWA